MLKLSRELFFKEQNPAYMDYYERALLEPGARLEAGPGQPRSCRLATYFIGLQPGAVRDFTPKNGTTCCEGTGMESATKYQDSVYFTAEDNSALYVNLYMPSKLNWADKNLTVTQETTYPLEQRSKLTVTGEGQFELRLRVPAWATAGFTVRVNGTPVHGQAAPGAYLNIPRAWKSGDSVEIEMPFTLRAERALDDPTVQTLMYGPVHLVALDSRTTFLPFSLYATAKLNGDLAPAVRPVAGKPLHFTLSGVELAPFLEGTADAFHSYFRRNEPKVVFGGVDSGVPNPARVNKTTLLDDVWDAASFVNKPELLKRVGQVNSSWMVEGALSQADADRIYRCAQRAAFTTPAGEIGDLALVADAARTAGTMTAEAHAMLGSRLESARKALAEKSTAKAVHYLKQYLDFAGHSVDSPALRDILVSGAQALIVRLTS